MPEFTQITLKSYQEEGSVNVDNFEVGKVDEDFAVKDDEVLVKLLCLSVDPYMRGRFRSGKSYMPPFEVGKPITSFAVGEVQESKLEGFAKGDKVLGAFQWRTYVKFNKDHVKPLYVSKLPEALPSPNLPLYSLGQVGMSAYFGYLDICQPKSGETTVVSGAAGGVGLLVVQLAKLQGCRVVGIAGSDEKVKLLKELGCDAVVNYRTTKDMKADLATACPKGVDCYFDNVGGSTTAAVYELLNDNARISVCGQISQYDLKADEREKVPEPTAKNVVKEGWLVFPKFGHKFPEGMQKMTQLLTEGKVKNIDHQVKGLENAPQAFVDMMQGKNIGKTVVML